MVSASSDGLLFHAGKGLFKGTNASSVTIVDGSISATGGLTVIGGPVTLPTGSVSAASVGPYTSGPFTSDWFRDSTLNQGIYNSAAGWGIGFNASGAFAYPSNQHILDTTPGSIATANIAANAVQGPLGSYNAAATFATTTTSAWLATPVSVSVTTGGGLLRVDLATVAHHSVLGATFYTGLGADGGISAGLSLTNQPAAFYDVSISWTYYLTLAAGTHTLALFIYNGAAGTFTLSASVNHFLFVTEQKR